MSQQPPSGETHSNTWSSVSKAARDRAFPAERRGKENPSVRLPRIRKLSNLMDEAFRIPGTNRRIGLDSLVGLIPGIGDFATVFVSAYIVREAWLLEVPTHKLVRMVGNIALDAIVGSIPLLGDVFDVAFKANTKNVEIIEKHVQQNSTVEGNVVE